MPFAPQVLPSVRPPRVVWEVANVGSLAPAFAEDVGFVTTRVIGHHPSGPYRLRHLLSFSHTSTRRGCAARTLSRHQPRRGHRPNSSNRRALHRHSRALSAVGERQWLPALNVVRDSSGNRVRARQRRECSLRDVTPQLYGDVYAI